MRKYVITQSRRRRLPPAGAATHDDARPAPEVGCCGSACATVAAHCPPAICAATLGRPGTSVRRRSRAAAAAPCAAGEVCRACTSAERYCWVRTAPYSRLGLGPIRPLPGRHIAHSFISFAGAPATIGRQAVARSECRPSELCWMTAVNTHDLRQSWPASFSLFEKALLATAKAIYASNSIVRGSRCRLRTCGNFGKTPCLALSPSSVACVIMAGRARAKTRCDARSLCLLHVVNEGTCGTDTPAWNRIVYIVQLVVTDLHMTQRELEGRGEAPHEPPTRLYLPTTRLHD